MTPKKDVTNRSCSFCGCGRPAIGRYRSEPVCQHCYDIETAFIVHEAKRAKVELVYAEHIKRDVARGFPIACKNLGIHWDPASVDSNSRFTTHS